MSKSSFYVSFDRDLMDAITRLDDPFARIGLTLLRGTGLRLGEVGTERTVPFDAATLAALDEWMALRGPQRALPHPRHGRPADFSVLRARPPPVRLPAPPRTR